MKKIYLLILLALAFAQFIYAQTCTTKSDKVITEETPYNVPCANFTARDNVTLLPGFSFSSICTGQPQIVLLTWNYTIDPYWQPTATLNGIYAEGPKLPQNPGYEGFYSSISELASELRNKLGLDWLIYSESEGYPGTAEIRISKNEAFGYSANSFNSQFVQEYIESTNQASFNAKIDNSLIFNVNYIPTSSVPDADNRTLDKSLVVGSAAGGAGVSPSGAASYNIPITVPPGLGNMVPQLSIAYNSQGGNGLLGWGWNLSGLSAISRMPQTIYSDGSAKGVQIDANDKYALDGNKLVLHGSGNYGANNAEYRTEMETFSKIVSYGTYNGPERLEVQDKSGNKYQYGGTTAVNGGRLKYSSGSTNAVLAWHIDYAEDPLGNYIKYEYEQVGLTIYLKKIFYGCNKNNDTQNYNTVEFFYEKRTDPIPVHYGNVNSSMDRVLYKVVVKNGFSVFRQYNFEYANLSSTDPFTRLVKINEADGNGKTYNPTVMNWGDYNSADITMTSSSESFPVTHPAGYSIDGKFLYARDVNGDGRDDIIVKFYNYSTYGSQNTYVSCFYNNSTSNSPSFTAPTTPIRIGNIYGGWKKKFFSTISIGNIDGNSIRNTIIPDFDYGTGTALKASFCKLSFGTGVKTLIGTEQALQTSAPVPPSYTIADINNDGYDEIIYIENYALVSTVTFPGRIYLPKLNQWLDFNILKPNQLYVDDYNPVQMFPADYNGDGLVDILVTAKYGYKILINKGGDRGDGCPAFESSGYYTNFNSEYGQISPGDFNGDGLVDFILCERDSKIWWLARNNGNLGFDKTRLTDITLDQYSDYESSLRDNIIVTDFNNDGKSDVIVFDSHDGKFDIQWFQSNGTEMKKVHSAHSDSNADELTLSGKYTAGDFNGDGRTDILNYGWNCFDGSDATQQCRIYGTPNTTNNNAGLVTTIANGINHKTAFIYKPLTDASAGVYSKTSAPSYPLMTFTAPLYVVSQISSDNGIITNGKYGQSCISYNYENALVHLQGKGFMGFAKTIQTDNAGSIRTKSYFNPTTDIETNCYTVKKQTSEVFSFSGTTETLISKTGNTFGYNLFSGKHIFYHPLTSTSTDYLRYITVTKTNTYDGTTAVPYNGKGNLVSEDVEYGTGRKDYVTTLYKEYTNAGSFIENKPKLIETTKKHGDDASFFTSKVRYTYDATKGFVLTKTSFEELAADKKIVVTYTHHPQYGLVTSESVAYHDMVYNTNSKTFGDSPDLTTKENYYTYTNDGRFLKTKSAKLSTDNFFVTEYEYNAIGNLLSEKSPAGFTTRYEYNNPFNGLSKTINHDDTWSAISAGWVSPVSNNELYYATATATTSAPMTKYFDLLGRELRGITKDFKNNNVTTATSYNAKGQLEWTTLPYFDIATPVKKYATYDNYGRPLSQYFDTNEQPVSFEYTSGSTKVKTTYAGIGRFSEKTTDVWGNVQFTSDALGNTVWHNYKSRGVPWLISAAGVTTRMEYDEYGNQTKLIDPSAGERTYLYNSLGQLYQQTDQKGNKSSTIYDALGRTTTQYIGNETVNYTYDTQIKGALTSVVNSNGTSFSYTYDTNNGRLTDKSETINGKTFTMGYEYNSTTGDLVKTTYPSGFVTQNEYDGFGNMVKIKENNGKTIWNATDVNALGAITVYKLGEAACERIVTRGYDKYGTLETINTPNVMNLQWHYDPVKRNVDWRKDITRSITESFSYDELDRLTNWGVGAAYSINYSGITIDKKTDVSAQSYTYQPGNFKLSSLPGAIMEIRKPQNISYNDMNKITHIDEYEHGTTTGYSMDLTYDYAQNRKMVVLKKNSSSTELTRYYAFGCYEQEERNGTTRKIDYIEGASAIHVSNGGQDTIYYLYTDHQGSWVAVTNNINPDYKKYQAFDPWGRRRNPSDWSLSNASTGFPFSRGYTSHEHMDMFGSINMNGRVYDAALGMFLSPDNYVQAPDMAQNFNRYSYCFNNPLMYTDPDGEWIHIVIGAAIGGVINLGIKAFQGKIHSWGDGFTAFGIGAVAGGVGAATGGAAFAAMGGAAGGAGGFLAGAAGGMVGSAASMPIQSIGNSMYFGDPMMTGKQYLMGIGIGGLLGGTINGGIALGNGRSFWNGDFTGTGVPTPGPTPILKFDEPEVKLNTDGVRSQLKPMPDMTEQQTFLQVKSGDGNVRWIRLEQQDLTLSPRQSLHLGNVPGKSPLTIDPSTALADLNKGNFQFVQLNSRGMPIVKFNYNIGEVISQSGQSLGTTSYGTVHLNSMGQVHIVPWLPKW